VDADDRRSRPRADLDEITDLVDDPQASAAGLFGTRPAPTGEWIGERPVITHLAEHGVGLDPESDLSLPAAVAQAGPTATRTVSSAARPWRMNGSVAARNCPSPLYKRASWRKVERAVTSR
jgi:hypothetical protein